MIGADAIGTSDLRLVWPQWQGAGSESIRALASESHFEVARRGYCVGTNVLQAVRPEHDGPTAVVPVEMGDAGLEERDGIEAKTVLLHQLRDALDILQDHNAARITTLGGGVLGEHGAVLLSDQQVRRRHGAAPLVDWQHRIGATKVAIHFDVDTIDANKIQLGLGADVGGLTSTEARRVVADIYGEVGVVALTIAEYVPRQVMHLQQILAGFHYSPHTI